MKTKHFTIRQDGVVMLIGWNSPGNANTLDTEVVEEFLAIQRHIAASPIAGSVLFSLKQDTGLGANIQTIYEAKKEEEVCEKLTALHNMFFEIKKLTAKKPCVMVVDGLCLGGVYELGLLFPRIIATDNPRTAIGVPEGRLGLIQGLGFLKRAPARIGILNTILLATSGKSVYAYPAEKMGLVDEVVANIGSNIRTLEMVAKENVVRVAKNRVCEISEGAKFKSAVGFLEKVFRFVQKLPIVRHVIFSIAFHKTHDATHGHYPANPLMVDVMENGFSKSERRACLKAEMPVFARLAVSPLAKRLMGIFFAKEEAKKMKLEGGVKFNPATDHMAVVGGGFMGGQIAFLLAKNGFSVSLVDINREILAGTMTEMAKKVRSDKSLRPNQKTALLARIRPTGSYDTLSGVRCFIDATTEDLGIKRKVLESCQKAAPDAFVFFNTSTIPIEIISKNTLHPERVTLLHFFSPVDKMEPVEIGGGLCTSRATLATAYELSKTLGKIPFVVGDNWGFVVNRILMAGMQAGLTLLAKGYRVRDIDEAMKEYGFALDSLHPMGPFELADFVGTRTASHVGEFLKNLPDFTEFPDLLKEMAQNDLTFWVKKEGRLVENPKLYEFLKKKGWTEKSKKLPQREIVDAILHPMRNEALGCVRSKTIGTEKTLDLLLLLAAGIPPAFRGGLLEEMHEEEVRSSTGKTVVFSANDEAFFVK